MSEILSVKKISLTNWTFFYSMWMSVWRCFESVIYLNISLNSISSLFVRQQWTKKKQVEKAVELRTSINLVLNGALAAKWRHETRVWVSFLRKQIQEKNELKKFSCFLCLFDPLNNFFYALSARLLFFYSSLKQKKKAKKNKKKKIMNSS